MTFLGSGSFNSAARVIGFSMPISIKLMPRRDRMVQRLPIFLETADYEEKKKGN